MSARAPAPFNVFIDSDGPVADFRRAMLEAGAEADEFKLRPGVYLWLPVTPGAAGALEELREHDDADRLRVWILTKTPSRSPYAYTEKVLWYRQHFPWLEDRVILAHDKSLLGTADDLLLDDRPHKGNVSLFRGTFVLFEEDHPFDSWERLAAKVFRRLRGV